MAAIISNQVDIVMASTQVAQPKVESKHLKALAVTIKTHSPALPNGPTLAGPASNTPTSTSRFGLPCSDPRVCPEPTRLKLKKAIEKTIASPAVKEKVAGLDITADFGNGAALQKQLANEIKNWKTFIEDYIPQAQ